MLTLHQVHIQLQSQRVQNDAKLKLILLQYIAQDIVGLETGMKKTNQKKQEQYM